MARCLRYSRRKTSRTDRQVGVLLRTHSACGHGASGTDLRGDRLVDRLPPIRPDFTEAAQQVDPAGQPGVVRIELPHDVEELLEDRLAVVIRPLLDERTSRDIRATPSLAAIANAA